MNTSFKREQRHRLSINDALIQHLKDKGIYYKINTLENQTRYFFITYPQLIKLTQANQDIILVNNTYKTNKFDILLFYMISK